jgi:two-component system cell cycle response regulator
LFLTVIPPFFSQISLLTAFLFGVIMGALYCGGRMYTILHLETSLLYKTLIHELCDEMGVRYLNAENADEAAGLLESDPVSLIITAMEIENGNPVEFIKAVNETDFNHIPIVVFTGNDSLDARKIMYELGIVDYILKSTGKEAVRQNILSFRNEEPVDSRMQSLRYAVLDDSKIDRMIIERIFAMYAIPDVTYFESAPALLNSDLKYDVYLVDIVLRETTGDKVIVQIKRKHPDSVVIAVSGIDNVKTVSRVLSTGADDFLNKPFNHQLFLARLKTNIRSYLLLQDVAKMAVTDGLTGMFNRRHVFERLSHEIEKFTRYGSGFSLLMLDIDHFKQINDTYGHQFGDEVLRKVSDAIRSSIRNVDIAGRYGGEEFMVILPEIGLAGAALVAERIRCAVESVSFENDGLVVTISCGAAEYSAEDAGEFVKKADTLLYLAKDGGRNRVCC